MDNIEINNKYIIEKLDTFILKKRIPNILFYGIDNLQKKNIIDYFINKIYNNNKTQIKKNVIYINCSYENGIKFIREDIKFFAKTNINIENGSFFKSIILINADKLTIDAQSALRRCIELYNDKTRFFLIVENNFKILKPICSRFCHIYVENIKKENNENVFSNIILKNNKLLTNYLNKDINNINDLLSLTCKIYDKGLSCLDVINYIENNFNDDLFKKYQILCYFNKIKYEIRNEKLLIFMILYFFKFRFIDNLENILFI